MPQDPARPETKLHNSWIKARVDSLSPDQRKRSAVVVVAVLALVALAWGLQVYVLPQYRLKPVAAKVLKGELKDGDIIFQTSRSAQSQAIQLATHSKYSHCGLLFRADSGQREWLVLEAVQPVKWTPLNSWIARGAGAHCVIKRPQVDPPLSEQTVLKVKADGENFLGKDYDPYFGWSDECIYCSELVWKAYHQATGLEIGKPQRLRDFDLTNPVVAQQLKARYGDRLPLDEAVISPARIFNSPLLITVAEQ